LLLLVMRFKDYKVLKPNLMHERTILPLLYKRVMLLYKRVMPRWARRSSFKPNLRRVSAILMLLVLRLRGGGRSLDANLLLRVKMRRGFNANLMLQIHGLMRRRRQRHGLDANLLLQMRGLMRSNANLRLLVTRWRGFEAHSLLLGARAMLMCGDFKPILLRNNSPPQTPRNRRNNSPRNRRNNSPPQTLQTRNFKLV
jgi:hypothetical protein